MKVWPKLALETQCKKNTPTSTTNQEAMWRTCCRAGLMGQVYLQTFHHTLHIPPHESDLSLICFAKVDKLRGLSGYRRGRPQHTSGLPAGCHYNPEQSKVVTSKTKLQNYCPRINLRGEDLLSPSGDLGIGLVWDNLSNPIQSPPRLFGLTVEILFKLN